MLTRFEWDAAKAATNLRKHGVSFEVAVRAFADPFALTGPERVERGEQRWQTLGMVDGYLLLLVAHTVLELKADNRIVEVSVSSQPGGPTGRKGDGRKGDGRKGDGRKGDVMSKKSVKHEVDLANLPPLSDKQKTELAALAARADEDIDYSDIPALTAEFWKNAERGKFYKPTKTSTTVRIDSDVLAWLRSQGKGYQSRINAILRREMLESLK